MRVADKTLEGVTCIRLDATVTFAHSDKELAEPNFKGFGHHPMIAFCDNAAGEPLAWMLRPGSAGSNTAADHLRLLDEAITALPPACRRKLMITCDGAGCQPRPGGAPGPARGPARLPAHLLRRLGARRAGEGRDRLVPETAWEIAVDGRGEVRERRSDDACATRAVRTASAGSRKHTSPS